MTNRIINNAHKEKLVYIIQLRTKTFHNQNIIKSDYNIIYPEKQLFEKFNKILIN